jgi:VIT1/CCC1 family predicted Fe2+/Mn2+ transporter
MRRTSVLRIMISVVFVVNLQLHTPCSSFQRATSALTLFIFDDTPKRRTSLAPVRICSTATAAVTVHSDSWRQVRQVV